jgi:hypothetical protein
MTNITLSAVFRDMKKLAVPGKDKAGRPIWRWSYLGKTIRGAYSDSDAAKILYSMVVLRLKEDDLWKGGPEDERD